MPARSVYHVVPDGGAWAVESEGSSRARSRHGTKDEALDAGVKLARAHPPSQLKIHKADGTIESERTYGDDPFPPKG